MRPIRVFTKLCCGRREAVLRWWCVVRFRLCCQHAACKDGECNQREFQDTCPLLVDESSGRYFTRRTSFEIPSIPPLCLLRLSKGSASQARPCRELILPSSQDPRRQSKFHPSTCPRSGSRQSACGPRARFHSCPGRTPRSTPARRRASLASTPPRTDRRNPRRSRLL